MRLAGGLIRKVPQVAERLDLIALLDEFAPRFYEELDYNIECENGVRIAREMADLPQVVIPKPYPALTRRRVHVAEWVDGEKLSQRTTSATSSTSASSRTSRSCSRAASSTPTRTRATCCARPTAGSRSSTSGS